MHQSLSGEKEDSDVNMNLLDLLPYVCDILSVAKMCVSLGLLEELINVFAQLSVQDLIPSLFL